MKGISIISIFVIIYISIVNSSPCGNGICEMDENCITCNKDCQLPCSLCGDKYCEQSEIGVCSQDCPIDTCGDKICSTVERTYSNCSSDCGALNSPYTISAVLDNNANTFTLTFSEAVVGTSSFGVVSCSSLFDTSSLNLLGNSPQCFWKTTTALLVAFSYSSSIRPLSIMSFNPNSIKSVSTGLSVVSGVRISLPSSGLTAPEAILNSRTASSCDPIWLDGLSSSRASTYEWTLLNPVDASISSVLAAAHNQPFVQVNTTVGVTYTVKLTVTDNYGRINFATTNVTRAFLPIPMVEINGPSVIDVDESESWIITSYYHEAVCRTWNLTWILVSVPYWSTEPFVNLTGLNSTLDSLPIPSYAFSPGTYSLKLLYTESAPGYPYQSIYSEVYATINVKKEPLKVLISGASRSVPVNTAVTLAPKYLGSTVPSSSTVFSWKCLNSNGVNTISGSLSTLTFTATENVSCTLTITDSGLTTTASVDIFAITDVASTSISLSALMDPPPMTKRIVLAGSTTSSLFSWQSTPALPSAAMLSDPAKQLNLVILPTALNPGTTYKITLSTPSGSFASVNLHTPVAPFGGSLSVTPKSGIATCTGFTFDFTGWSSASGNAKLLNYGLFYKNSAGQLISLRWFSQQLHHELVRLPLGLNTSYVTVYGAIRDENEMVTYISVNVSTTAPSSILLCAATLEEEMYRYDDVDYLFGLMGVAIGTLTPQQAADFETAWKLLKPTFYQTYMANFVRTMYNIATADAVYRVAVSFNEILVGWRLSSVDLKTVMTNTVAALTEQALKFGLGNTRQTIMPLLDIYDTMTKYYLSAGIDASVKARLTNILDIIQADVKTHVCGEVGQYTTDTIDVINMKLSASDSTFKTDALTVSLLTSSSDCLTTSITVYSNTDMLTVDLTDVSSTILSVTVSDNTFVTDDTTVVVEYNSGNLKKIDGNSNQKYQCMWKNTTGTWSQCPTNATSYGSVVCSCPNNGIYGVTTVTTNPSSAVTYVISAIAIFVSVLISLSF